MTMTLDLRDIEFLRLTGKYRWLPYKKLGQFGFTHMQGSMEDLLHNGYLKVSQDARYVKTSAKGYAVLDQHGYPYSMTVKRPGAQNNTLRRRLETSEIMLACLRAGMNVFRDINVHPCEQPVFYPSFDFRTGETNIMANATSAGFGHWGGVAYMLHYVSQQSDSLYYTNEKGILSKLAYQFTNRSDTPAAMIFAGSDYPSVYRHVQKTPPKRKRETAYLLFTEAYRKADIPVHLLSCDETGAVQLAIMRQPGYRTVIAKNGFAEDWVPQDADILEADGQVNGYTIAVAVDMDIKRIERIVADARILGRNKVLLVSLQGQCDGLLTQVYPKDGFIQHMPLKPEFIQRVFGKNLLYDVGDAKAGERHA